jgi:hypothetical protein
LLKALVVLAFAQMKRINKKSAFTAALKSRGNMEMLVGFNALNVRAAASNFLILIAWKLTL